MHNTSNLSNWSPTISPYPHHSHLKHWPSDHRVAPHTRASVRHPHARHASRSAYGCANRKQTMHDYLFRCSKALNILLTSEKSVPGHTRQHGASYLAPFHNATWIVVQHAPVWSFLIEVRVRLVDYLHFGNFGNQRERVHNSCFGHISVNRVLST